MWTWALNLSSFNFTAHLDCVVLEISSETGCASLLLGTVDPQESLWAHGACSPISGCVGQARQEGDRGLAAGSSFSS